MSDYEREKINNVLKQNNSAYKIKIISLDNETPWMNISPEQLKKIRQIIG